MELIGNGFIFNSSFYEDNCLKTAGFYTKLRHIIRDRLVHDGCSCLKLVIVDETCLTNILALIITTSTKTECV